MNLNKNLTQFLPARNSPKEISGASEGFLPKPLLLRLRHPNSKKISRVFCEILSPKNSFRKTESALVPPPAQKLLGQNTKEKCPFLFRRKNRARANPKSKEHFSLVSAEALRGELSAKAPLGYFNEPRLRTIEPDKKTFNKVKETLRAFAIGNYTLTQIQSKMFSLGLVGPRSGKKMPLSSVEHILKNPFYYGHFLYRGELHQGSHKPMITKKLFDQIQQALKDNGKPRKKRKEKKELLFLNFARCGECGYCITADRKIKKSGREYVYYFCTRKSKIQNCSQNRFLREESFAEQVKENCQKVSLPDVWRGRYLAKLKEWENENRQTSDLFAQNLRKDISAIKTKLERLTDAYLEEALELAEYQQTKNALMAEKKTKEEKLSDFERKGNRWLELSSFRRASSPSVFKTLGNSWRKPRPEPAPLARARSIPFQILKCGPER